MSGYLIHKEEETAKFHLGKTDKKQIKIEVDRGTRGGMADSCTKRVNVLGPQTSYHNIENGINLYGCIARQRTQH